MLKLRGFEALEAEMAERAMIQRNADFGNDGPFISAFLKRVEKKPEGFDLAEETIGILGGGHLHICYCCPYTEITLRELARLSSVIAHIPEPKKICSAGLEGNAKTWERLLSLPPTKMIGNGLQHCISRTVAIMQLWRDNLSVESLKNTRLFLDKAEQVVKGKWRSSLRFTPRVRLEILELLDEAEAALISCEGRAGKAT